MNSKPTENFLRTLLLVLGGVLSICGMTQPRALVAASLPAPQLAHPAVGLTLMGGWPGYIREAPSVIDVEGQLAYLAGEGGTLTIVDISDSANPVVVGGPHLVVEHPGDGDLENMDVAGGLAYLAVESDGLTVVDVRNPAQPIQLGHYTGDAQAVHVIDSLAFLGIDQDFKVIEVSNPTNLVLVGQVGLGDYPEDVFVTNEQAYVVLEAGRLQLIDVSNSALPVLIGSCRLPILAHDVGVFAAGAFVYVADSSAGLQIIDVSNPASPFIAGQHRGAGYAINVQVAGPYAFVAAYGSGLQVFEVSNPSVPYWISTFTNNPWTLDLAVQGDRAYGVGEAGWWTIQGSAYTFVRGESFLVADVANPTNMTRLGGLTSEPGDNFAVHVVGNLACLADTVGGTRLLDLSTPTQPQLLATIETRGEAWGVRLSGHHLFVTDDRGLQIFDVSAPSTPVFLGTFITPERCMELEVAGRYAYVTGSDAVLKILDISQPAQPVLVGEYRTGWDSEGIQLVGHLAYVAAGWLGLHIVDVSNPALPRLVGSYPGNDVDDVAVSGDLAFLADVNGMVVLNVSNPAAPSFLAMATTGEEAEGVRVFGDLAFVTDEDAGFFVFNVSDPRHPTQVAHYPTFDAQDVDFAGNLALVADGAQGLQVFEVSGLPPSAPVITASPESQSIAPGQRVVFTVSATGSLPLSYQWLKNGAPIPGATQSSLVFPNVSFPDAANYSVVAGNAYGFALSDAAQLAIELPLQFGELVSTNGMFGMQLGGCPAGSTVVLESSTNLMDWVTLLTLADPASFLDLAFPISTNAPARFYRAVVW